MAIVDLATGLAYKILHEAQAITANANGLSVDTKVSQGASMTIVVAAGVFSGTSPTATWTLEDSDDDSAFLAVPTNFLIGAIPVITDTNDQAVYSVGYTGRRRYVRLRVATGGTSPSLLVAVTAIQGMKRHQ